MDNGWNIPSDEEDYTDENFENFLKKTKECLAKFNKKETVEDNGECKVIKDERDLEFIKFLGTLKSQSHKSEKCNSTFSLQRPSPNQSLKSNSSLLEESQKQVTAAKTESTTTSTSSLCKFESQFLVDREKCTRNLYDYFNDKIFENKFPLDMDLKWSNDLRTTAGTTRAKRTGNTYHSCSITLSTKVLTTFERLCDTLLHEMCHAAVFVISQIPGDSHGPLWHTWAARCNLVFPDIAIPQRCHNYVIEYPFYYQCTNCSWKCGRYKRSVKLNTARCPDCKSTLFLIKS